MTKVVESKVDRGGGGWGLIQHIQIECLTVSVVTFVELIAL